MMGAVPHSFPFAVNEASVADNRAHDSAPLPLSLRFILFTLFLPEGMSFFIADLRLTFTRAIFLVITPLVFMEFKKKVSTGQYRFVLSDLFVVLTSLWMFVGPAVTYNLSDSLVHSGPVVMEYLIAYMATRVLLTQHGQAQAFVSLLCIFISFVVLDALLDTATGQYFTRDLVDQLTGYQKVWNAADEYRFGLLRAAGPIEHPILFGIISTIGLIFAISVKIRWRTFCIVMCVVGVVICFSAAPEQGALMGLGLLLYGRLASSLRSKWLWLSVTPVIVMIFLFISTPSPFGHIFDLITINPQTAYYRLYIWNTVGPAILDHPYFAVRPTEYDYTGSIDSLWLVLSLQYGMVCSIMTALSMAGCCSLPTNRPGACLSLADSMLGRALGIIIFLIMFLGFTVHFWGPTWILVGLLVGLRAHIGELGQLSWAMARQTKDATQASFT